MQPRLVSLILISSVFVASCGSDPERIAIAKQEDTRQLREEWLRSYARVANESTERTYQCISEMYSLAYTPVNGGPVCKDACDLIHKVDEMVQQAPPYIENPNQYAIGKSKVCVDRKAKKAK